MSNQNEKPGAKPEDFSPILMDEKGKPVEPQRTIDPQKLAEVIAGVSHCSAGGISPDKLAAVIAGVSHCSAGGIEPEKLAAVIAGVSHCSAGGIEPEKLAAIIAGVSHCSAAVPTAKLAAEPAPQTPTAPPVADFNRSIQYLSQAICNLSELMLRSKK